MAEQLGGQLITGSRYSLLDNSPEDMLIQYSFSWGMFSIARLPTENSSFLASLTAVQLDVFE